MPDKEIKKLLDDVNLEEASESVIQTITERAGELLIDDGELSDDELARAFGSAWLDENGRYLTDRGMWLFWDDTKWSPSHKTEIMGRVREYIRHKAAELEEMPGWSSIKQKERQKVMSGLRSAGKISAVARISQTNPASEAISQEFDADPEMINTPDGLVNLRTGDIRPSVRTDMVTKSTRISPAIGSPTKFLAWMNWASDGDQSWVDYMQVRAGYNLIGHGNDQKVFFDYGPGGNGKSTFDEILTGIMGEYSVKLPTKYLMSSGLSEHPTGLADIRGARKVTASEVPRGERWNLEIIKNLSGDEEFEARKMRSDYIRFPVTWTLNIIGNNRPTIPKVDNAITRRMVLVPFSRVITDGEKKRGLSARLLQTEGPQIFQWMISGALMYLQDGLPRCERIQSATADYMKGEDVVGMFISDYLTEEQGSWIADSQLRQLFSDFADRQGIKVWRTKAIRDAIMEARSRVVGTKRDGYRGLKNIRVADGAENQASGTETDLDDPNCPF